jgi:thiol-disulfide isomerase/thioredoxin
VNRLPRKYAGLAAFSLMTFSALAQTNHETRILDYIRHHLRAGEPLLVTDLYNKVFIQPEERKALDKLYSAFFRIPLFVAEYQEKFTAPPSLKVIAEQFDLGTPEAAKVLVQVMEADPRVPRFFTRDQETGEITHVDIDKIRSDPRFGKPLERELTGWEGKAAPNFTLEGLDGGAVDSASLAGKVGVVYVWFTGCPPCMKETPELVALERDLSAHGLAIVGANADHLLGLAYDDSVRRRYIEGQKINFPVVHWTRESNASFGNVSIFPTIFLVNRKGVITRHWVGFVSQQELRQAIAKLL